MMIKTRRQLLKISLVAFLRVLCPRKAEAISTSQLNYVESNKTYTTLFGDHYNNLVVFGNPDVPTEFQNHMKMEFWGENYISFHDEGVKGTPILEGERLTLDTPEKTYYWEPRTQNQMRWVEILKVKPVSNKWSLKIADGGQFNYKYQTPLTELAKEIPGSRIEYVTEDGEEHIHLIYPPGGPVKHQGRPLEIEGSIAVYHRTKRDNHIGGKNYRTGKVLHIPRPKAVDKNGDWVWCDIDVKSGVYTRTVPQSFLDNAVYPVTINDTFGYWSSGASYNGLSANYQFACNKGQPAASGSATSMSCYARLVNDTVTFTMGLWADNAGAPGTLLRDTGEEDNGGADLTQWWDSNFDSAIAIDSANTYWLGLNEEDNAGLMRLYGDTDSEDSDSENIAYVSGTLDNFATPLDTGLTTVHSIYVTYTPSGAAAGQVIIIN